MILRNIYQSWSTDKLMEELDKHDGYQSEAVSCILDVLSERDLTDTQKRSVEAIAKEATSGTMREANRRISPSIG